ncbi:MAG: RibD family protein [Alphaproteobacteria bacterium]|nr:RibD family protein [Alphaproteobacteria bacterium]
MAATERVPPHAGPARTLLSGQKRVVSHPALRARAGAVVTAADAWDWLLALARGVQRPASGLALDAAHGWRAEGPVEPDALALLDLYLPLCALRGQRRSAYVIAHLGQSLDGRIATAGGASHYVTGPDNIRHLHRLRALFDAVVVGAGTVALDDPRLTVREVAGPNPVRVVIDARRRLDAARRVFTDGAAPSLLACASPLAGQAGPGGVGVIGVPPLGDGLCMRSLLQALAARGLKRVFVEGGGVTVSRFLEQGTLDRLQIAVAPMIIGSGRPAVTLPPIERLELSVRPRVRHVAMGADILFDCEFGG